MDWQGSRGGVRYGTVWFVTVGHGKAVKVSQGSACHGGDRYGKAVMSCLGTEGVLCPGEAKQGIVRQLWQVRARRVSECSGAVGHGSMGMLWSVGIGKGKVRIGVAVKVRQRWERRGAFWYGAAVEAVLGSVSRGKPPRGSSGHGSRGVACWGEAGSVGACRGTVWQSRRGALCRGKSWNSGSCQGSHV